MTFVAMNAGVRPCSAMKARTGTITPLLQHSTTPFFYHEQAC